MPALASAVDRMPQYTPVPSEAAASPAEKMVGHQCFSGGGGGASGGNSIFGCTRGGGGGGSGGGGFGSSTGGGGAGGIFGVASAFSFSNARRVLGLTGPGSSS